MLTVPASFDEVARELTLARPSRPGSSPVLLEEPHGRVLRRRCAASDAIRELVGARRRRRSAPCSCATSAAARPISRSWASRRPSAPPWFAVRRIAVGRHLLLGGDNMDLALAHVAEARLVEEGGRPHRAGGARAARALVPRGEGAHPRRRRRPTTRASRVLGRGSKLVGGARSTTLKREEVERVVLDGFFPEVERGRAPDKPRGGIVVVRPARTSATRRSRATCGSSSRATPARCRAARPMRSSSTAASSTRSPSSRR